MILTLWFLICAINPNRLLNHIVDVSSTERNIEGLELYLEASAWGPEGEWSAGENFAVVRKCTHSFHTILSDSFWV